eukprot:IDg1491t1
MSAATVSKPSKKAVVELLMSKQPDIKKNVSSRSGANVRRDVTYSVYNCPKGTGCKYEGRVLFEKGSGYTNPYRHLRTCLSAGDEKHLLIVYRDALADLQGRASVANRIAFQITAIAANERQKAMHAYLRLVTLNNYPMSHVQNEELRAFSKFDEQIGKNEFKNTMLYLVELVEKSIKYEMQSTRGAVMYDGWTEGGVHYLGIYAVYVRKVDVMRRGVNHQGEEVAITLLSVSPMAKSDQRVQDDDASEQVSEATSFDAVTHIRHFEDVFSVFDLNLHEWTVCIIGDNASVNRLVSELLGKPFIGCASHKLNLEVQRMIRKDKALSDLIDSIHATMSSCHRKLRDRAMLRNLTSLAPVLHNKTRWSSKYIMIKRFNEIRDSIIEVANTEGATVAVERSPIFYRKSKRYEKQLQVIDQCTLELQKRGSTVSDCRFSLDVLMQSIDSYKQDASSPLYNCRLERHYIDVYSLRTTDVDFENGVTRIQRGEADQMTDSEREACKTLLQPSAASATHEDCTTSPEGQELSIASMVRERKRRRLLQREKYVNCNFILGSVAEVERLWSIAKNVRSSSRKSLTPLLFESILFLKVNKEYWNLEVVIQAMNVERSARVNARLQQEQNQIALQ